MQKNEEKTNSETEGYELSEEREHLIRCLARTILRRPLGARRHFLKRYGLRHGELAQSNLEKFMTEEHEKNKIIKEESRQEIQQCLKRKGV